nr:tRNA (adenosine(37)-N6)-dimethylallyltransferase MiaA [Desulfobacterales bacterium]
MHVKPSLIIILGPTGVGKTSTALEIIEPLDGEIISADSMQVYRRMNIGTAKPTPEEQARVRHNLIDVVDPDQEFNAAMFKDLADRVIHNLYRKGKPIFVVGGTGLYIRALIQGLFPGAEGDETIRQALRKEAESMGATALYTRLERIDPVAAKRIHHNDMYRIVRALEVFEVTGRRLSELHRSHNFGQERYHTLKIGLTVERGVLYQRIDRRVDQMIESGLLREVKDLLNDGYLPNLKPMRSIGYRHMCEYCEGKLSWNEAVRTFKRDTRHYAKRQLTWFRRDHDILWFEPRQIDEIRMQIDKFLSVRKKE